jgi:hypothetical protein
MSAVARVEFVSDMVVGVRWINIVVLSAYAPSHEKGYYPNDSFMRN